MWRPASAILLLFVSHMLLLYPTLHPLSQWWGRVVTSFETLEKEVWLTIDDGPTDDTIAMLDLLDSRGAKATFFVKGTSARKDGAVIERIFERGHSIGNHSHSHPSATFWCLGPRRLEFEILEADASLAAAGQATTFFRAPVGMKNFFVHPILERLGKTLIGWNIRAFDGVRFDPLRASETILERLKPGAIVLLHEGRKDFRTGARINIELLRLVLDGLQRQGYRAVIPHPSRLRPASSRPASSQ